MKGYARGISIGLIAVFGFATYTVLGKTLTESISPFTIVAFGRIFAVMTLCFIFGFLPELQKIHELPKRDLGWIFVGAMLTNVCSPLLYLFAISMTTATDAILITRLFAVFSGIISFIWLREKLSGVQAFGIAFMFFGIVIITTESFAVSITSNPANLLLILTAFLSAVEVNVFKRYLTHVSPELVVITRHLIGTVILLGIAMVIPGLRSDFAALWNPSLFFLFLAFALFSLALPELLWYKALEHVPANVLSSLAILSPFFGIALAIIFLHEHIFLYHISGGLFVAAGLLLTVFHHQKHPEHALHEKTKGWLN